jgi:hypothetical protein
MTDRSRTDKTENAGLYTIRHFSFIVVSLHPEISENIAYIFAKNNRKMA